MGQGLLFPSVVNIELGLARGRFLARWQWSCKAYDRDCFFVIKDNNNGIQNISL